MGLRKHRKKSHILVVESGGTVLELQPLAPENDQSTSQNAVLQEQHTAPTIDENTSTLPSPLLHFIQKDDVEQLQMLLNNLNGEERSDLINKPLEEHLDNDEEEDIEKYSTMHRWFRKQKRDDNRHLLIRRLPLHLAIQYRSSNCLQMLLTLQETDPLVRERKDNSNILHTLVRCAAYLPSEEPLLSLFGQLRRQLLRATMLRILKEEDTNGRRPLELCVLCGAYKLFHELVNVNGYTLHSQIQLPSRKRKIYDLSEYCLSSGRRYDRSPLLDITRVNQSDTRRLANSRFLNTPLIHAWAEHYFLHSKWLRWLRILISFILLAPLLDCVLYLVMGKALTPYMAIGLLGKHCYKRQALETNESHTGTDNLHLLDVKSFNCEYDIYPILQISLDLCRAWSAITLFLLAGEFVVYSVQWFRNGDKHNRCYQASHDLPGQSHTNRRLASHQSYKIVRLIAAVCGLSRAFLLKEYFSTNILLVLKRPLSQPVSLWKVLANDTTCTVLWLTLYTYSFCQIFEVISYTTSRLFYSFRIMINEFLRTTPLLFFWTYLFSICYFGYEHQSADNQNFVSTFLNTLSRANRAPELSSYAATREWTGPILTTLSVLMLSTCMTKFLTSYMTNILGLVLSNFRIVHFILRLEYLRETWYYFGWPFRFYYHIRYHRNNNEDYRPPKQFMVVNEPDFQIQL